MPGVHTSTCHNSNIQNADPQNIDSPLNVHKDTGCFIKMAPYIGWFFAHLHCKYRTRKKDKKGIKI